MASRRRIFSARNDVMNFPSEVARGAMVARQMYWKKKEGKLIWPLTYRNEVAGGLESNPAPENLKGISLLQASTSARTEAPASLYFRIHSWKAQTLGKLKMGEN